MNRTAMVVIVLAAVAALQQQIADGTVTQATLDAFEKIHTDLTAALNPTPAPVARKK